MFNKVGFSYPSLEYLNAFQTISEPKATATSAQKLKSMLTISKTPHNTMMIPTRIPQVGPSMGTPKQISSSLYLRRLVLFSFNELPQFLQYSRSSSFSVPHFVQKTINNHWNLENKLQYKWSLNDSAIPLPLMHSKYQI